MYWVPLCIFPPMGIHSSGFRSRCLFSNYIDSIGEETIFYHGNWIAIRPLCWNGHFVFDRLLKLWQFFSLLNTISGSFRKHLVRLTVTISCHSIRSPVDYVFNCLLAMEFICIFQPFVFSAYWVHWISHTHKESFKRNQYSHHAESAFSCVESNYVLLPRALHSRFTTR